MADDKSNYRYWSCFGVDHGWSGMKTVSQVFTTGVKEITTEPAFYNNVVDMLIEDSALGEGGVLESLCG